MSKVVIQGNASGTGNFTIAAPNSNTDRTFNLPDSSGTVATTSDIPSVDGISGSYTSGTALNVDSSGYVLTPNNPCFSVSGTTGYTATATVNGVANTVQYNSVTKGVNSSGFDTSTGVYTAPVAGAYLFQWANLTATNLSGAGGLWKNGGYSYAGYSYSERLKSFQAIDTAEVGDYFQITHLASVYLSSTSYSYWSITFLG
jgi:hypothetical protein